jgi:hypothetical protein
VLGLIRLPSVPFLGAFSVGIARNRPRLLRITVPSSERADHLRRLGVDQARGIDLPVRVVPVTPAVGEPLPKPGARDLAAELGLETAPGVPRPGRHRTLELAQLDLHVGLQRARNDSGKFHQHRPGNCGR